VARLGEENAREYGRMLNDLTVARKSAEVALETQKLESIGVMAGGIAHDFNNLLTSILGKASLAIAGMPADDPALPMLDVVERASRNAAGLIAQLLAYAGNTEVVITRFDLSGWLPRYFRLSGRRYRGQRSCNSFCLRTYPG